MLAQRLELIQIHSIGFTASILPSLRRREHQTQPSPSRMQACQISGRSECQAGAHSAGALLGVFLGEGPGLQAPQHDEFSLRSPQHSIAVTLHGAC